MTPAEHRSAAETLGAEAFKFQGAFSKATRAKQDGSERSRVTLSVVNYVNFLQQQAQFHALMAAVPAVSPIDQVYERLVLKQGESDG